MQLWEDRQRLWWRRRTEANQTTGSCQLLLHTSSSSLWMLVNLTVLFWFSNIPTMCYCGFHNAQVKIAYFEPLPCIPCFITITFCFISHQLQQELFTLQCASTYRRTQQIRVFENFTRCNTSVLGMKGCGPDSKIRGQEQNMARATSSLLQT